MATIEDFVNHRWEDAKESLRSLDSEFVRRVESKVRLDALNLSAPWSLDEIGVIPNRRLSKKWHNLLEACAELMMQLSLVEESTAVLTEDNHTGVPLERAGRMALFHFRAWVIFAQTLTECVCRVIDSSAQTYVEDKARWKELTALYKNRVKEEFRHFNEIRNEFVHGSPSWIKGITEEGHWESGVACGLTPRLLHNEFVYPQQGEFLQLGKYHYLAIVTTNMQSRIGLILEEFETSLASYRRLTP